MKLTNFTFLRAGGEGLLKSLLILLVFMTLSLGVEAQQLAAEGPAAEAGISMVDQAKAVQRLSSHLESLMAIVPADENEEMNLAIRLGYAQFILSDMNHSMYKWNAMKGQEWLEAFNGRLGPTVRQDVGEVYNEMIDLLRS